MNYSTVCCLQLPQVLKLEPRLWKKDCQSNIPKIILSLHLTKENFIKISMQKRIKIQKMVILLQCLKIILRDPTKSGKSKKQMA